jgi:hypothetical protein
VVVITELQSSFISASSHPADTDRLWLEGLMNPAGAPVSGAAYGVGRGTTELKVQEKGTPDMSVDVLAGHCWIDGTENANQGVYHGYNDATKNLAISAAHATLARKDLVVAKVQDAAYSGGTNAWSLAVVTGTPAGSPAEPTVPANAIVLALVDVAALAASIVNANITDRRRRACALGGRVVCTSSSRPTTGLFEGLGIFETDTDKELTYDGAAWVEEDALGAWESWTPTLANLTLGNGTVGAKFRRQGRTIHYHFRFTLGSTSAVGTAPTFSLPVAVSSNYIVQLQTHLGLATYRDDSTGVYYQGYVGLSTASVVELVTWLSSGTYPTLAQVQAGTPITWTTSDVIFVSGTYEAAS